MCGLAGELRFDQKNSAHTVAQMLHHIERRGPHHKQMFSNNILNLCHARLKVIDLADHANQPMTDHTRGHTLVFNGTIYNYPELYRELYKLGHQFTGYGDTEVILKAYAEWGEDCVSHLDGIYAIAVWDLRRRTLFLARDRLGIKPLYYAHTPRFFRFASNTQALLAAGDIDTGIDRVALHHHLTLHAVVPAPDTVLKNIKKLPPATTMTVNIEGKIRQKTYWHPDARRPDKPLSENEWQERTRDALSNAVIRRYETADVPTGVLLSGGLDSGLIAALLAKAGKEVRTWSVGFDSVGDEAGDEFYYSDMVVDRYALQHERIRIDNNTLIESLPDVIGQMPEPMVGQDCAGFYLLSQQVSKQIRVVQCGQGADELFGGYFWYPLMDDETGTPLERFRKHYFDRSHEEYSDAITPPYRLDDDVTSDMVARLLAGANADTFMDAVWHTDVTTLIVDDPVKRVDSMTLSWGLETHVPFLDIPLVELAMRMPPELKVARKNGAAVGKYILKKIAGDLLPEEVIHRRKGYFPVPMLKHLRGKVLELARDTLLSEQCQARGLFERDYINRLLANPEQHYTALHGSKLWHHTVLELWLQTHVDKR